MTKVVTPEMATALWSQSQLATAFGLDRRTVAKRLKPAPVADVVRGGKVYTLAVAAKAVLMSMADPGDLHDPAKMEPGDRLSWFKSERERLLFEQEVRELVLDAEHRAECALIIKTCVLMLETLPDVLERDCGLPPKAVAAVEARIDGIRNDLAEKLIEAAPDDAD
ncbi:DUF1441 family protein [Ferrimonas aestuarii]|uniref:DUF1441 family protein n=1 Tax=Ferrimonas aestuarii TaxID=2569539 RepID=A0A4U1BL97_9GAMM|nr:DUF1441 family protein [Ferrimonas aestuarii]TKB53298.1 DUF1441 family protein [Ferrimonas aestuarii]